MKAEFFEDKCKTTREDTGLFALRMKIGMSYIYGRWSVFEKSGIRRNSAEDLGGGTSGTVADSWVSYRPGRLFLLLTEGFLYCSLRMSVAVGRLSCESCGLSWMAIDDYC